MVKTIVKEFFILLLLSAVVILLLAIIFYDYLPMNSEKVIPQKIAYEIPEEINEELKNATEDEKQQIIVTYEINDVGTIKYEKGKSNPFALNPTSGTNITVDSGSNNNSNTSTPSTGTLFESPNYK